MVRRDAGRTAVLIAGDLSSPGRRSSAARPSTSTCPIQPSRRTPRRSSRSALGRFAH